MGITIQRIIIIQSHMLSGTLSGGLSGNVQLPVYSFVHWRGCVATQIPVLSPHKVLKHFEKYILLVNSFLNEIIDY